MNSWIRSDEVSAAKPRKTTGLPPAPQLVMVHVGDTAQGPSVFAVDVRPSQSQASEAPQAADEASLTVHETTVRNTTIRDTIVHDIGGSSGGVRARPVTSFYKAAAVVTIAVIGIGALGSVLFPNLPKEDVQSASPSMVVAAAPEGATAQHTEDSSDNSQATQTATPAPQVEQAAFVVASANPASQAQPQQRPDDEQQSRPQQPSDQQQPQAQQQPNDQQSQQAQPQQKVKSILSREEIERLTNLGEKFLAQGDVATARKLLQHAAEARDPRAALVLGATYDPDGLRRMGVVGLPPDLKLAHLWYTRAAEFGSREASQRLAALPQVNR
jgi:chemotaxis protein histidine kinase CheA